MKVYKIEAIFTGILTISMQAAIAAFIIIIVKKLFVNKVNLRIGYLLWVPVLIRLLFPVLPSSPVSVFNYIDLQKSAMIAHSDSNNVAQTYQGSDSAISATVDNAASKGESSAAFSKGPIPVSEDVSYPVILRIFAYVWAVGVLLTGGYFIIANAAFAVEIKSLKPVCLPEDLILKLKSKSKLKRTVKFVESPKIASPCVFGIIRCTIILPEGLVDRFDENTILNILTHEFAHIKHWDLLFIWLSSLLCSIHWFNPILWYGAIIMRREQELCADAYVMFQSDEDEKTEYGMMLLAMARNTRQHRPALVTAGINENKRSFKERIRSIALFSNKKYRITLLGLLLIVLAGIFVCTSQVEYPRTAEERMKFDENVMFEVVTNNYINPKRIELKIHNKNEIGINSCELAVYYGNPYKTESSRIFSSSNFRIGAKQVKSFIIDNIDYYKANITFNYKAGLTLNKQSNRTQMSGDLQIFDKTAVVNGWAAVTDQETAQFIKTNKISSVVMNKIYNLQTIIMFENGNASGYYELYKDTKLNKVMSRWVKGISGSGEQPPVSRMGGTASGSYPFVCIKINNPALMIMGEKMELVSDYGTKTTYMWGAKAYAIETRGCGNINKILIYGKSGKLIYDGEKSLVGNVSF